MRTKPSSGFESLALTKRVRSLNSPVDAASIRISVSDRGTSARPSMENGRPKKSHSPTRCCTGRPASRFSQSASKRDSASTGSSSRGSRASGRPWPIEWASSSRASHGVASAARFRIERAAASRTSRTIMLGPSRRAGAPPGTAPRAARRARPGCRRGPPRAGAS